MAKPLKVCKNTECSEYNKKEKQKQNVNYCWSCGSKLYYVCKGKNCYTVLHTEKEEYCSRCEAINAGKKINVKGITKSVAAIGATAVVVASKANPFNKKK